MERTRVLVIGDSHAKVFAHPLLADALPHAEFVLATVAGATVSGLENPNSGTRALSTFKSRIEDAGAQHAVVMLGEVDTGFVLWYRAQKYGAAVDEMLERTLGNYRRFLLDLSARMRVTCISTPLPTIRDGEVWGDVANARREVTATQVQRTQLTLRFNREVQAFCEANDIGYLMLDPASLGADGLVRPELLNPDRADHHYDPARHARMLAQGLQGLWREDPLRYHIYSADRHEAAAAAHDPMNEVDIAERRDHETHDAKKAEAAEHKRRKMEMAARQDREKLAQRYARAGVFILSFPKSGRTWVRTVVAHYLALRYGVPFDIEFEADDRRFRRPCFTHNYFDVYRHVPGEPSLLKPECLRELPLVLLVRDPRDVCASYFHHIKLRDKRWKGDAMEFARSDVYGIERQSRFVELLLQFYKSHPGPKVLVRYEDLRRKPHEGFRQLISLIDGSSVDDAALREAVARSSFERMQQEEKSTVLTGVKSAGHARLGITDANQDSNALKVRKGKVGGYVADFGMRNAVKLTLLPVTRRLLLKMKLLPWSAT